MFSSTLKFILVSPLSIAAILPSVSVEISNGEKVEIDESVWFYELKKELIAKKYSRRTVKLYLHYNEEFLKFCNKNSVSGVQ